MIRAAVLPAVGAPLEITGIELPEPGPGRVRIRLAAAGVCHSDLSLTNGTMRDGRFDLGALVTERITLDGIPGAFDAMLAGKGGRALVVF